MSEAEPELNVLLAAGRFEVRGSCAYSLRLARCLPECRVTPTLVSPDLRLVDARLRRELPLRESRRLEMPIWGRIIREFLVRDLGAQSWSLLHVQSRRAASLGAWLARRLRIPYVLTVHHHVAPHESLRIDRRWCRRVIAVSQSVKDHLIGRMGWSDDFVSVIPSGVEVDLKVDCPKALDPGHLPVIGTAGPLEAVKGLPFFLGAAQRLLAEGREVEFLVAGAGPEEGNLRRIARELEIAHKVTFVPYLLDFTESLAAMDIFCLPSLQQGLGTVMLEAMALGRPVIASGVGGISSIVIDGRTGLVVPPQNSAELARRMSELLDNPSRARSIAATARRLVETEFDVHRMVAQTADLYREVLHPERAAVIPLPSRAT